MEYPTESKAVRVSSNLNSFREFVRSEIVDQVPAETFQETTSPLPLQYDTSISGIHTALLPHVTGEVKNNAVYVIECLQTPATGSALQNGVTSYSVDKYSSARDARRVIYVGVAKNLIKRLDEHINSPGESGANFTALFSPIRVLQVGWFRTYDRAEQAEKLTANLLRERFPQDFVAYPG